MMRVLVAAVFVLSALSTSPAQAYPTFIGYGYTSCLTCHFNPYGNGPLSDYGRALSATTISGRPPFVSKKVSDDDLGNASGFLGPVDLGEHFRPAFSYRRLLLVSQLDKDRKVRSYQMQADANIVIKAGEDDKYYFSGTVGYAPNPQGAPTTEGNLISREHYVGARVSEKWGVYAGFADVLYGLRTPDHIAYNRQMTGLAQNDQVHGVFTHYASEKFEGGVHAFAGNLYQEGSVRPKGLSATSEYEAWKKGRVGASALYSENDFRKRWMSALHLRAQIIEGHGVIGELGVIHEKSGLPASTFSDYLFVQSMHRLFRGFHVLMTAEHYTLKAFEPSARYYRFGPSIQWLPFQRLELRSDLQDTRRVEGGKSTNTLNLLAQVHLTF